MHFSEVVNEIPVLRIGRISDKLEIHFGEYNIRVENSRSDSSELVVNGYRVCFYEEDVIISYSGSELSVFDPSRQVSYVTGGRSISEFRDTCVVEIPGYYSVSMKIDGEGEVEYAYIENSYKHAFDVEVSSLLDKVKDLIKAY